MVIGLYMWIITLKSESHDPMDSWNSPGQSTGVGSLSLLQGIFPMQGSNPDLLHCRQILYQLSCQESPGKLEWVAFPFSRGLPNPGIEPRSPALHFAPTKTHRLTKQMKICAHMHFHLPHYST